MRKEYKELINSLIDYGYLKTPLIIEAFFNIDRKDFVLPEYEDEAYGNYPLPIGYSQTISQPLTVAFMLELLQPLPGEKILDIGAGSGWQSALLAAIVSKEKNGKVIAVERIKELVDFARENISKYNFIKKEIVKLILTDGSKGYKEEAPYNKIIAGASAQEIPLAWQKQLKIGGKIVAPVKNSIVVLEKITKNRFQKKEYFGFSFVPLVKD